MNKSGGYTWIQSCATIVCNAKNNDEQHIICVNYVISARENSNLIMDQCQLEIIKREIREPVSVEKEIKSPAHDTKDETHETAKNFVKVETPIAESKVAPGAPKKALPEAKIEEPATRGRKRKNKQDTPDTKKQPLPPATSILSESSCKDTDLVKERSESSVKDLENAMSKHLPSPSSNHATDFSTDSLLKHQDKESWNSSSASTYAEAVASDAGDVAAATALREPRKRHQSGPTELRLPRRSASDTAGRVSERELSSELRDFLRLQRGRVQQQHDDAAKLGVASRSQQFE